MPKFLRRHSVAVLTISALASFHIVNAQNAGSGNAFRDNPAWTVVDWIAVPQLAATFLIVRLVCDIPMLWVMWALWKLPVGRRRPEVLTFAVLALVQLEIAWMVPLTRGHEYYLLGFTLAVYGSGCMLVARPCWTAGVVAVSWIALAIPVAVILWYGLRPHRQGQSPRAFHR